MMRPVFETKGRIMSELDQGTPPPSPQPATPPPATPVGGFDFNRPTIIGLLYVGSLISGISGLIGLVLAYIWKAEPHEPWEATHYTYLIRTFWIGLAASVLGALTMIILIGFPILLLACVWVIVRTVVSLVKAQQRAAMPDPQTLLF